MMLEELLAIPHAARNDDWLVRFFLAVPDAPLFVLAPQVAIGPDHFPYFQLALSTDQESVQPATLREVLPQCLKNGIGVVLNHTDKTDERPAWVFSLGNLVSLAYYQRFDGDPVDIDDLQRPPPPNNPEPKILVGSPDDDLLPDACRNALRKFLVNVIGWKNPRILLVISPDLRPGRNLMLNIPADTFRDNNHIKDFLGDVSWFLPPGRGLMIAHPDLADHAAWQAL